MFDQVKIETLSGSYFNDEKDKIFFLHLYDGFFKLSLTQIPKKVYEVFNDIERRYEKFTWYEVYDFIEYIANVHYQKKLVQQFRNEINLILEREMSGYRFIDEYIAPIIDEVEISEIEEALTSEYSGVKMHLGKALEFLSDRKNPDYQNSIKESISAVESIARIVSGKPNASLSNCLQHHIPFEMDKNFKGAMKKYIVGLHLWKV